MKQPLTHYLGGLNLALLLTAQADARAVRDARNALEAQGAMLKLVALTRFQIEPGEVVDMTLEQARADDFDGAIVAGGQKAEKLLREHEFGARFLRGLQKESKPLAVVEGDLAAATQSFVADLAARTRQSIRDSADDAPSAASMGG